MTEPPLTSLLQNAVREKLAAGEITVAMSVRLVRTADIAQIAQTSGFDAFYIDLEHSTIGLDDVGQIAAAALGAGISAFVRVPSISDIPRILDAGTMGVIVPHVTSAAEARAAVEAAKFPPLGSRSVSPTLPALRYRRYPLDEARRLLNERTTVIVMIESAAGVENAAAIAAVEGVDILLVGTNDLCADMGIHGQFEHEKVRAAYTTVMAACRRHGKHLGVGGLSERPVIMAELVKLGARFVMTGSDLQFLMAAAQDRAAAARKLM
jgi:2-keto-3-deoxy-L-rhamnonate aldolase RhmA